ncbi:hypothetical protein SH668x_000116 [Planctomicrobium sp. SH668]|uniref:hypothetical protein n=1 Tax=Planctomicrobium sp. SH668 TaxID=3448126 RepID=UPI003F5CA00E
MTHFTVGILIPPQELPDAETHIARLMAPYDENSNVESYVCYDLDQAELDRQLKIRHLEQLLAGPNRQIINAEYCRSRLQQLQEMTPFDCYEEFLQGHDIFDDQGRPVSTRNPKARWDWYVVGGRWGGWLHDHKASGRSISNNSAPVPHVLANEKFPFVLITPDGEWHERGKMGWWDMVTNEKDEAVWHDELRQLLQQYSDHHLVLIDAHI